MLTAAIVAGLALLLVGGLWQLTRVDLGGTQLKRKHLVSEDVAVLSRVDLRRPERLLEDPAKFRNVFAMTLELLIIAGSVVVASQVYTTSGVPLALEVLTGAALVLGIALVGRGLYVRSGLYRPALEEPADYGDSLANRLDEEVGEAFTGVHDALAEARGPEDPVDETLVCVLAGARAGCPADELVAWGETVGAADSERFHQQVETLTEAGLVAVEDGHLHLGDPVADADDGQIATVAESVL